MNRTITYTVEEGEDQLRFSTFLRKKGFSRQNIIELKKQETPLLVNGRPRRFNERTAPHDLVTVCIIRQSDLSLVPAALPVPIVYEDEDLLVVNKPAGMPTHPSYQNRENTLANALAWYFQQKHEPFVFHCSNRLDRDTSGLTVVAKHFVSANMLSVMGSNRDISREYLAIVKGTPDPLQGTVTAPLGRKSGSIIERCVDFEHGETAITHYTVLRQKDGHSLLSIHLETGRTHQIRIHMKYLGCPLIGDYLYYPDRSRIGRQALHAHTLAFCHPITGEALCFQAPMPEDMHRLFDAPKDTFGQQDGKKRRSSSYVTPSKSLCSVDFMELTHWL